MCEDNISILCATDEKYVPWCGIMLTSVFENNMDCIIDVYILVDSPMSKSVQKRFARMENKYRSHIHWIIVNDEILKKFPIKGMDYWSIATYYRLFAAELLPETVHRILYLDCDIIVDGSIRPLWNIDMESSAVGGVCDIFEFSGSCQKRLSYPVKAGYFNAGVLLINVDYWRNNNIGQLCLDYLESNYDIIEANDQDVLNAVLYDKKIGLDISYNYQIQFKKKYFYDQYDDDFRKKIDSVNPIIVHYAAKEKPWQVLYYKMPFKRLFFTYKNKSLWWHKLPELPRTKVFNYIIKRFILWPLGIKYNRIYKD